MSEKGYEGVWKRYLTSKYSSRKFYLGREDLKSKF